MTTNTIVTLTVLAFMGLTACVLLFWAENRKLRKENASLYSVIHQLTHSES